MAKGKGFFAEFKKFILRGNVLDLAVGVIIGGAFQAIVNSLVADVIMPVITMQVLLLWRLRIITKQLQILKKL